ncbi:MAG: hypothetical protein ACOY46_15680 [Bacillota bacterium]
MKRFYSNPLVLIFLPVLLFCSAMMLAPSPAGAGPANGKQSAIDVFYGNLALDPAGKDAVMNARARLCSLSRNPSEQPWVDVLNNPTYGLYNDRVKELFGGDEAVARQNVVDFVLCLEKVLYATDSDTLRDSLNEFRANPLTGSILSGCSSVEQLYKYLDGSKSNVPGATRANFAALIELASGNSWEANRKFSDVQKNLRDIGWNIERLVLVTHRIGYQVDPGYQGEFALIRAYMKSMMTKTRNK